MGECAGVRETRITKRFGDASVTYELPASRSTGGAVADIRARMAARQMMTLRQTEYFLRQLEIRDREIDDQLIGGPRAEAWRYR
jgi:hypothetical protein